MQIESRLIGSVNNLTISTGMNATLSLHGQHHNHIFEPDLYMQSEHWWRQVLQAHKQTPRKCEYMGFYKQ